MQKDTCPIYSKEPARYVLNEAPPQSMFQHILSIGKEVLSRLSLKSFKNAWLIGSSGDLSKAFLQGYKKEHLISKLVMPHEILYLTGNPQIMKLIFQNPRTHEEGLFQDTKNFQLLIEVILYDLYPDECQKMDATELASKLIFTANHQKIKYMRNPLAKTLGAAAVEELIPQLTQIAEDVLNALSEKEKSLCNGENLAFEYAMTIIGKLVTGYEGQRIDYIALVNAMTLFGKKIAYTLVNKSFDQKEEIEYQQAILLVRKAIGDSMHSKNPSQLVQNMKESGFDDLEMKSTLFIMYFAGTETTASSLNYLFWQLGKPEHKHYFDKLRDPDTKEGFLSQLIAETLRLHPASLYQGRELRKDTVLESYDADGNLLEQIRMSKKRSLICLPQNAGLNPDKFPNPYDFNPERFAPTDTRSQLSWYPFGAGTHVCPGQYLALAELKIFISCIISRFDIQILESSNQLEQKGMLTMRASPAMIKLIQNSE